MSRQRKLNFIILNGVNYQEVLKMYNLKMTDLPTLALFDNTGNRDSFLNKAEIKINVQGLEKWITEFLSSAVPPAGKSIKSVSPPEINDGPVKIVTRGTFDQEVIDNDKNVMIEFYAPWCGHCKNLAPIYEEIGKEFESDPKVVIANYDCEANTPPEAYEIMGYPILFLFLAKDKANPIPYEGTRGKEEIIAFIKEYV